jgi:hypothetical protein
MIKPSFIPAETINLILNNLEELIKKCNGTPDSTSVLQLADLISSQSLANKVIQRDTQGRAKVAAPAEADDIARKNEIDIHTNSATAIHGATDSATANRLIIRDVNGRAQVAAPAFDDDSLLIAPTKWVRENFNTRTIGDPVSFLYMPSAADMIRMRVLPLNGQVLPIVQYQDLFNVMWSSAIQASGDWWYKCTSNGTRDPDGIYFRVLDIRGLFMRAAGQNSLYKMANDAPYDGKSIGAFGQDATQNISGLVGWMPGGDQATGPFHPTEPTMLYMDATLPSDHAHMMFLEFDASRQVRTGPEITPAWIAVFVCIKY